MENRLEKLRLEIDGLIMEKQSQSILINAQFMNSLMPNC